MAHLNLRERLLETTIAYLGPPLAGKSTNLAYLRTTESIRRASETKEAKVGDASVFSFVCRPDRAQKFNDCEVSVKLFHVRGDLSRSEIEKEVGEIDGVVVVIDSAEGAHEQNLRSLEEAKSALDRDPPLPVVMQLNRSDLPGALSIEELTRSLDLDRFSRVIACAETGEGVVETFEKAVEAVLQSLKSSPLAIDAPPPEGVSLTGNIPQGAAKSSANPLLDALRSVLRDTVAELGGRIEDSISTRLTGSATEERREAIAREKKLAQQIDLRAAELHKAIEAHAAEARASEARTIEAQTIASRAIDARLDRIEKAIEALQTRAEAKLTLISAGVGQVNTGVTQLGTGVSQISAGVGQVNTGVTQLGTGVTQLGTGVSQINSGVGQLSTGVGRLSIGFGQLNTEVGQLTTELGQLTTELGQMAAGVVQINTGVEDLAVRALSAETQAERRAEKILATIEAFLTELKKQKKGWFG